MNTEQYENRSLFLQATATVIAMALLGVIGWIGFTVVQTKEVAVRIEERQSVIADGFRSLESSVDRQSNKIQDHEYRLRALERDSDRSER